MTTTRSMPWAASSPTPIPGASAPDCPHAAQPRLWGMAREEPLRDANHYAKEGQVVDYIVERMIDRTGMSRKEAVETLLHAYLTGESTGMDAVLGGEAWSRIVRASRDQEKVKKTAKRLLASRRNGAGSP